MKICGKLISTKRRVGERGDILLLTLAFVMVGFLLILPLVTFMGTGLKTGMVYNDKSKALYTADAGVEDAIWQIKYSRLLGTFADQNPAYDPFDFNSNGWTYSLPQISGQPVINNRNVSVNIKNIWIPQNVSAPSKTNANSIVDASKILVTGGAYGVSSFNIVITHYAGPSENLTIKSIGIWLPPGFTCIAGSSTLEADQQAVYYANPGSPIPHKGGQVLIWNYQTPVDFTSFPDVKTTDDPMTTSITFDYTPSQAGARPDGVAWITTGGVDLDGDGVSDGTHFAWDSDVRVFGIVSTSGETTVETYIAKSEMRKMGGAVNGNYYATGNTLMTGPSSGRNTYYTGIATVDTPTTQSSEDGIPENANISAAYLYWSAYRGESGVTRPLNDSCINMTNWTNGGGWSVDTGRNFLGHYAGGLESSRDLTSSSSYNLAAYAASSYITVISWEQWVLNSASLAPLDPETCENFDNWDKAVANSAWTISSSRFRGHANTDKDLTLKYNNLIDLRFCSPGTAIISWDQCVGGTPGSADKLNYSFSADGTTFPEIFEAFSGNIGGSWVRKSVEIPQTYLTADFRIRFSLVDFAGSNEYCYIDNVAVTIPSAPTYSSTDKLEFAISKDAGVTWSEYVQAVKGDLIGTSPYATESIYQYVVPRDYLTNSFKIKFHLGGFGDTGKYCGLDNIRINVMQPDTGIPFKIKVGSGTDNQVYFDANGNPAIGTTELTSFRTQAILAYYASSNDSPQAAGYAYGCYRDVTDLVRAYAEQPVDPATNYNGHGRYTVVNSSSNHIGDLGTALSYAGWSLVLIYTSPDTLAHQLYLYDKFIGSGQKPGIGLNVDFDGNGIPGGNITGFVVPQKIGNEINAAKITCFVGEGDSSLSGDYIAINGIKLWDGTNTTAPSESNPKPNNINQPENVWNGQSIIASNDGIDIDTLGLDPPNGQYITWASDILKPGDTEAEITLYTRTDYWFMCYMILSFRSETTTGGSLAYLIHG